MHRHSQLECKTQSPTVKLMALRAHLRVMAIVALLLTRWLLVTASTTIPNMRIVTYNLRYDALPDNLTVQDSLDALPNPLSEPSYLNVHQEQPWSTRRIRIAENLLSSNIDVACEPSRYLLVRLTNPIQGFQEALVRQVNDLSELFGSGWAWVSEDSEESSCFPSEVNQIHRLGLGETMASMQGSLVRCFTKGERKMAIMIHGRNHCVHFTSVPHSSYSHGTPSGFRTSRCLEVTATHLTFFVGTTLSSHPNIQVQVPFGSARPRVFLPSRLEMCSAYSTPTSTTSRMSSGG